MASLARADLETLLRTKQLDRTLTTAQPDAPDRTDPSVLASTGLAPLDARLCGGLPRGQLSEITGPRSSGRTSVVVHLLASAVERGELVALVDVLDMFDPASAEAAGLDLDRLLWVRGHMVTAPGLCRDMNQRALEQAIRALALVLQAGVCGLVVFDAAEAPSAALSRLPFTTWLRLQRLVEGSQTAVVLVGGAPMARSAAGVSVKLGGVQGSGFGVQGSEAGQGGARFDETLFKGIAIEAQIVRARAQVNERPVAVTAAAVNCA
jgi:recA bacterial DNA recombination protein